MACALTSGLTLDCRDQMGGVKEVYVCEFANVYGITSASGSISALSLSGTAKFRTYQQNPETAVFSEAPTPSTTNGTLFYNAQLEITLPRWSTTQRNELYLVAQNKLMIIVKTANDTYLMMGETRGAYLEPSTTSTGKASGDLAGYVLKFDSKEPLPCKFVSSSIIASITA